MADGRLDSEVEELMQRASAGDAAARQELLIRHRSRLRRMISVRMDRRLSARVDASDVVQETLAKAASQMDEYLEKPPLPFYPWLRRLACERMVDLYRHHNAQRRSVAREEPRELPFADRSTEALALRIAVSGTSPGDRLARDEQMERVRAALEELPERDREILVMRYLEQLSGVEIAAILGVREGVVRMRQLRAMERLRELLGDDMERSG